MRPAAGTASQILRFGSDRRGVAALEFALMLPFMLVLYFGTFQVSQAVSAYRKMTLTTRTIADLTTQYQTMGTQDVSDVMGAAAQIMTPFSVSKLSIVLTEIQYTASGQGTVIWSKAQNGTALKVGAKVVIPINIAPLQAYVVLSQVNYSYTPPVGYKLTGSIAMSNQIYMVPRMIAQIPYTGT